MIAAGGEFKRRTHLNDEADWHTQSSVRASYFSRPLAIPLIAVPSSVNNYNWPSRNTLLLSTLLQKEGHGTYPKHGKASNKEVSDG